VDFAAADGWGTVDGKAGVGVAGLGVIVFPDGVAPTAALGVVARAAVGAAAA
jgi:hypothetical protein